MTPNINPNSQETSTTPIQQAQNIAKDGGSAEKAVQGNAPKGYTMDTKVSSIEDLRTKAPEVFQKMMEGIAQSIISKMQRNQERLEQMWDESRRK